MIASLADAWQWFESARGLTRAMQRLGEKHWDELPWEGRLRRDDHLNQLEGEEILRRSQFVLDDLDDLCVLLLFSVFEATVRERVLDDIRAELPTVRHLALQRAIEALTEAVGHGSFYKVLDAYKKQDASLIEEVNQVRRYRNWVAHGRRGQRPEPVDPTLHAIDFSDSSTTSVNPSLARNRDGVVAM